MKGLKCVFIISSAFDIAGVGDADTPPAGHQVELACAYGVLEGPRVRQPAAVAPPRADLNSYTETNLWCFKSYSLTGAHCANHNIAHVKHDGTTMVPHYSRSLLCVCACMSVSPPLGRPVTPRASGMSDSLVDHSPRPRVALITPYGLGSVTTEFDCAWSSRRPLLFDLAQLSRRSTQKAR